jgi:hypothetical protein
MRRGLSLGAHLTGLDPGRARAGSTNAGWPLARTPYRNWFDSLSGARMGRKVGHPRFRSRKGHRAWIRLTRNGFSVTTGGGAGGEGRGRSPGVVSRPALCAVECGR